jgi:4-amino-4-deoxy-L-arabinose transferase-like glycosyltransferase
LLSKRKTLVLLLAILAVAAAVRFVDLNRLPQGVWMDEALKGVEGLQAVHTGEFRLFYPTNYGREGFWINLVGVSESIFGPTQFGVRFCSAVVGTLTVLFVFLLARDLFSDRMALLAAWFIATGFWHVLFSRLAFRAILVPFLLAAGLYFLTHAWKKQTSVTPSDPANPRFSVSPAYLAAIGGAIYGLGFHSYIAFRLSPLLVIVWFYLLWKHSDGFRKATVRLCAIWLGTAFVVALPIGIYFLIHRGDFIGRVSQVSIFADPHPVRVFLKTLLRTAGMFNFNGDCSWRHNIHCKPELILPIGILFALGLLLVIVRVWNKRELALGEALVLAWFIVMLLPELLTMERIPHSLRAIGAIPAVFMLTAIGSDKLFTLATGKKLWTNLLIVAIFLFGAYDVYRYFHEWAHNPALKATQAFCLRQAMIGKYFDSLPTETPRYVLLEASALHQEAARHEPFPPMMAQPIAFATLEHTSPVYYFTKELFGITDLRPEFPSGSVIATVEADPETWSGMEPRANLSEVRARELFAELEKHGVKLQIFKAGEVTLARVQ